MIKSGIQQEDWQAKNISKYDLIKDINVVGLGFGELK